MKRTSISLAIALTVLIAACGDSDDSTSANAPPTTAAPATSPPATDAPAATTAAPATTVAPTTAAPTTTEVMGTEVTASSTYQTFTPYNDAGAALFPEGSVEAHWYQSNGEFVVLFRGLDATTVGPLCPGNSIFTSGFEHVSNSPLGASADQVCVGVPNVADADHGVRTCGSLIYYLTVIPTSLEGDLYASLEINDGSGFAGQTAVAAGALDGIPEFLPGEPAYLLPATDVDAGGLVSC